MEDQGTKRAQGVIVTFGMHTYPGSVFREWDQVGVGRSLVAACSLLSK